MNRNLEGAIGKVIDIFSVFLTLFALQIIVLGPKLGYNKSLAIFLVLALPMTFFIYAGGKSSFMMKINIIDIIFAVLSFASIGYLVINAEYILTRVEYISPLTTADYVLGIIAIIAVLEATRRAIGLPMAIIALLLFVYAYFGKMLPPPFGHAGFTIKWIIDTMYLTSRGIFGSPLWVVITLAFPFIFYGVILEQIGVLKSFLDFANRLFGKSPGAPAKTSVVAGTFMGMASGMPMSTTYLIGFPTIPEMIKVGYPARTAGAIAAVVGTAAQLMPPMLGVAAFIVAQYMGVPYIKVCQYTLLPALLFYAVFFLTIHLETKRLGIKAVEIPTISYKQIMLGGFYIFLITLAILLYFLLKFYPVGLAAFYGCVAALVLGAVRKDNRLDLKGFYVVLAKTGRTSVYIAIACAAAGIITGFLVETGLNLKFANMVIAFGQSSLFLSLMLSAIAILVMSMGMPSIPAYITSIAIFGPALIRLGVIPEVAHIFCFYYATLYSITPPVAFASYAGAQIAHEDPMKTGLVACRLGIMTYIIPFIFAYAPAYLMIPEYWNLSEVFRLIVFVIPGLIIFAVGISGYLTRPLQKFDRTLALAAGLMLLLPFSFMDYAGFALMVIVLFRQGFIASLMKRGQNVTANGN
ncbi:TRAP transporter permease [Desulfoscipio geothermicus]|uniref:TRAP transporter, 4TM/12TM fusion protein n=1 Tax=Desulfoscipio geothermicus DSM 3669 TaxID=1121426 RepID=A0A1I6DGQ6_9FIRM|nr:TRAP transporter fused permease subunit [Desulfoscipio geothermicus]SFR04623.1 TRAP transporter, 4TM/12TM fusion protein [Desulfoscipio geothermicus DSM 3669]